MSRPINIVGATFNSLTVVRRVENTRYGESQWLCNCSCGNTAVVRGKCILSGHSKSCGCLVRETTKNINLRHGRKNTPEHRAWAGMKQRCNNSKNPKYADYGGRGISVCSRWLNSFDNFLLDMGERPSNLHSLDRIEVDGNYEPGNCRWAISEIQQRNKRCNRLIVTPWGRITLAEASEKSGISYNTLKSRLKYGFTSEKLFANISS